MHVCLDVGYSLNDAVAACIGFADWLESEPSISLTAHIKSIRDYVPGRFYERELPCLLEVLSKLNSPPETIIVDGHVRLDSSDSPGLGKHLYYRLSQKTTVIGVAKSAFKGLEDAVSICRGDSSRPLYITAVGMPDMEAAECIRKMHGPHRIPTMLKLVDQLSRKNEA